jgi:DNA-binding beta-propeller fold protein YncE
MTRALTTAALYLCLPATGADKLVLVAGGGNGPDGGKAVGAALVSPFGTAFDADGTLYFVEMEKGERLRSVGRDGTVRTVAGTGKKGNDGDGMLGPQASFNGMHSLAVGPEGVIYLADTWNNRIRTFDPTTGRVAKFAGGGVKGFGGDGGPADKAGFGGVYCVAFDPDLKNLYVADLDTRRIRRIDVATKTVSTVAGTGTKGTPKDGEDAGSQPLIDPRAVAADKDGTVYVLERGGHCLRAVDKQGKIRTVAGTGRAGALVGAAKISQFNGPKHLCVDRDGTVLIADTENHRVVRFDPKAAVVTLVAGTGVAGRAGLDGDPLRAELFQPHGVSVHPKTGEIYICDSGNHRIVKLER